ncbi:MAG: VWA domain-containing protein [Gemmatimonadota bacterium]|nr:MAG: VWA domain-containing protein [Gemmatimonadota bacterium]
MIAFDTPILFFLAPAVGVLVFAFAIWARRVRINKAGNWSNELRAEAASSGRWGPYVLGLAGVLATVALAGPRWGSRVVETESKGLNLVVAVDISRSMLAEDANPSRLERAKRETRRLIHDLRGDRIGLVAFAGQSHILSPLTVDGSALNLLVDALHPDIASAGGSDLARALRQGRELLLAKDEVADRVLVIFTDGEAHDSVAEIMSAAERLRRDRVRLVLVAEGGTEPVRIPVRDVDGTFLGYQRDPSDREVATMRRDDILTGVADAAQGMLVSASVGDQAGAVRDLIAAFKRSPEATTTAAQDISRAWIPLFIAAVLLLLHTITRRTMALAMVTLSLALSETASAQGPRNAADDAWLRGDFAAAVSEYLQQAQLGEGGDTVLFNLGTAAMALGDTGVARTALVTAARSIEPDLRFRALFNLGLLELVLADRDSTNRGDHLEEARRYYREALLIRPNDMDAKWNYELTFEMMPPESGSGAEDEQAQPSPADSESEPAAPQGLSAAQAEQILNSIAEEERQTQERLNRRRSQLGETRGRRDW